ncbi:hypothetical protein TVAG_236480 [Trichomonas vaginalis G3]|uniref:Uncharacterized protein n=1 Tax=Trichomonas vaginalis (strain ATCC PRA-98 / G3) TaxID=412133 RepID=A2G9X2_TRIV3|nr:hypothetical protein TVAG_236480 [Trichomonas vaginalis G3]|eukprot:XP_001298976.1 hypothetical protein [Trichomonas vaginalis G3]
MKAVQIGLHCDDIEVRMSKNIRLSYDCVASMWEALLVGHADVFTTIVMLVHFLTDSDCKTIKKFCAKYSLAELWIYFRHSDNINLQTLSLIGLTIAVQYHHPDLSILRTNQNLDRLFNILNNPDEDICNEGLNLLTAICENDQHVINYFISKGIFQKLQNIECYMYYGSFLASLIQYNIPSYDEILQLAIPCIDSKYPNNVKSFFSIANQFLEQSSNDESLANVLLQICEQNIENLASQADDFVVNEIQQFLCNYEHVPESFCQLALTFVSNSFLPDATGRNDIIHAALLILDHFSGDWQVDHGKEITTFLIQIYKTLNFENQKMIAKNIIDYYNTTDEYINDVIHLFVDFMDDSFIGTNCQEKLISLLSGSSGLPVIREMFDEITNKCIECMESENDTLSSMSEQLYNIIENY